MMFSESRRRPVRDLAMTMLQSNCSSREANLLSYVQVEASPELRLPPPALDRSVQAGESAG